MIVAIHQPNFLPWPGFFHKMVCADVFILLNKVQYVKNALFNRNRIKTPHGVHYLTVPVHVHRHTDSYDEIRIDVLSRDRWTRKHLKTIEWAYAAAPYFDEYFGPMEELYRRPWERLIDLNMAFIGFLRDALRVDTRILLESEMHLTGTGTARLVSLCGQVHGSVYLSGDGSPYLQEDLFVREGLEVCYQSFVFPSYPQLHGPFASHLSVIDVLFNCGPDAMDIIHSQQPGTTPSLRQGTSL